MPEPMIDLFREIQDRIRRFATDRDWDKFHSPKNLVMALSAECGELIEHFQWLTEEQSRNLNSEVRQEVGTEIADVFIYLIRLGQVLELDLLDQVRAQTGIRLKKAFHLETSFLTTKRFAEFGQRGFPLHDCQIKS